MATVKSPYEADRSSPKTFTLPVSGSVVLFGPEAKIVASPEFQRLAGLKQLGTSYVVFRGAIHTRFEHSIGALHEAERMVSAINDNPYSQVPVDDRGRRLARLGALLHDLAHVPFGHTLEDELLLLKRHDENEFRRITLLDNSSIGEIVKEAIGEDEYQLLLKALTVKKEDEFVQLGEHAYVADIIGNTLCADLLDYVKRDLTACGMPVALGDRFLEYLTIAEPTEGSESDHYRTVLNIAKRNMPRPDVESEVVKLLSYRYELAERVYFHHAKNAASVMIGRAVREAGLAVGAEETSDAGDANFHWISDEMLLEALRIPAIREAKGLVQVGAGDEDLASRLAGGVLQRSLYKIAYLAVDDDLAYGAEKSFDRYKNPDARRALEDQLSAQTGLEPGEVLLHVPRPKMMTKEADIRVRTGQREVVPYRLWDQRHSRRVNALNEAHRRLWRLAVYVRPEKFESHGALVRAAAESVFKAPARYVDEPKYSPLLGLLFDQVAHADGLTTVNKEEVLSGVQGLDVSQTRAEFESSIRERIRLVQADSNETESDPPADIRNA